jgi:hypothetical protein
VALGPGGAVAARPSVEAQRGVAVTGYVRKEEEEGELWPGARGMQWRDSSYRQKEQRERLVAALSDRGFYTHGNATSGHHRPREPTTKRHVVLEGLTSRPHMSALSSSFRNS